MKTRRITTVRQALASDIPRRRGTYKYVAGEFLLTASFSPKVDKTKIALAGALAAHFSYARIADMLHVSPATVGKMVRVFYAGNR